MVPPKKIPHPACLLARLLGYIHRHVFRYVPLDVPCRRAQIRRNLVELFLTATLIRSGGDSTDGGKKHVRGVPSRIKYPEKDGIM